mmetsp:Transcript_21656/g.61346  ORF Transcript_21656/g.61346 Transcript_21656/m.61346 type:complete len:244 (-) Transcript_21656:1018-1749(-)
MDEKYHFSNWSKCTLTFRGLGAASPSSPASESAEDPFTLMISETTSSISCCCGLCPSRTSIFSISSWSRMPSPFLSSLSKTRRTSTSMRSSLTVYHLRKFSKASLSSLVNGILLHSFEAASSFMLLTSSSAGGVQPSFCMNILNSASVMWPSPSVSISLNDSCKEHFSSVKTAMPAVSVMLACCVRSLTMPLRNCEGILRFLSGLVWRLASLSCSSSSGTTAFLLHQDSTQSLTLSLMVMKPQ